MNESGPKCVAASTLASAAISPDGDVDLIVTDGRRLRAKLGTEHEHHIGTVRNVGYRFVVPTRKGSSEAAARSSADA